MIEPSSHRLVVGVAAALRDRIAPLVANDPWAASELRSIDTVLALVAGRLEHEADVLAEDNDALRLLFAELADGGVDVVGGAEPLDVGDDPVRANLAFRTALEATLHRLHDGAHDEQLAAVRHYLIGAAEREQRIYGALAGRRAV